MSSDGAIIIGLGEAMFDVFPDRAILGGAPLNVAVMAHQLLEKRGGRGIPVSRIGTDELGDDLTMELRGRRVSVEGLQRDKYHPTGQMIVTLNDGEPTYEMMPDIAWDFLEWTDTLQELAANCSAVCYGTLAQRNETTRGTVTQFLHHAPQAIRLFDVNLRQQFYSAELILTGCELATVVKFNQEELPIVAELLQLEHSTFPTGIMELQERFELDAVIYTMGELGTQLLTDEGIVAISTPGFPPHPDADSVGAGDACSAAALVGMLDGKSTHEIVTAANRLGAYVASQPGATPRVSLDLLLELS